MNDIAHPLAALGDRSLDPIFWPPERLGVASASWPHVPFGHWVVSTARPRLLVELGTGAGASYSAFCQAVVRGALGTLCYAIDSPRDAKVFNEKVFDDRTRLHREHFGVFSTLVHSTFDRASSLFADGTVDLLHIGGLHPSEALKHNFETWKPKLSERAVVLVHNTNLRSGASCVWSELRQQFPNFEFPHGHGLGLLVVGKDVSSAIVDLCSLGEAARAAVRRRFAAMAERWLCEARETQCIAASATEIEQVWAEAHAWEALAKDYARTCEQIKLHIEMAQRDVCEANLMVDQAQAAVALATNRAEQADYQENRARLDLEYVVKERDALLSSIIWRATRPLRVGANLLSPRLRKVFSRRR